MSVTKIELNKETLITAKDYIQHEVNKKINFPEKKFIKYFLKWQIN
jgi:hypothetical protein